MMTAIIVAMTFAVSWTVPSDNCDGSALTDLDHYLLETERIIKIGQRIDPDGTIWEVAQRTFLSMSLAPDVLNEELTDPEVGGMIAWRVSAYDFAGNRDCETEISSP